MSVPSRGEVFSRLIHHLREAQSQSAIMAHLHRTEDSLKDRKMTAGWLMIEDMLKQQIHKITLMAQGKLY
jgi:hypothetical protein